MTNEQQKFVDHVMIDHKVEVTESSIGICIKIDSSLYLNSATSIPDYTDIIASGNLHLNNVHSIGKGSHLWSGGTMFLDSLMLMSEDVHLNSSYINMNKLKTIPAGAKITAKVLNVPKVETISEDAIVEAKNFNLGRKVRVTMA